MKKIVILIIFFAVLTIVQGAVIFLTPYIIDAPGMYCFLQDIYSYPVNAKILINISTSLDLVVGDYTLHIETTKHYVDNTTAFHTLINDEYFYRYAEWIEVNMYANETALEISVDNIYNATLTTLYNHVLYGNYSRYRFNIIVYDVNESEADLYPIEVYTLEQINCNIYHYNGYTVKFTLFPIHDNNTIIFPYLNMTLENYIETVNTTIYTHTGAITYRNKTFYLPIPIIHGDRFYIIKEIKSSSDKYYVAHYDVCDLYNKTNCVSDQNGLTWFNDFRIFQVEWKYSSESGYYSKVFVYTSNEVYAYTYNIPDLFKLLIDDYSIGLVKNFTVVSVSLYYDIYTTDPRCFATGSARFLNITETYVLYKSTYLTDSELNAIDTNITLVATNTSIDINASWINDGDKIEWWKSSPIIEKKNISWNNTSAELSSYNTSINDNELSPPDWYNVPGWISYIFNIFVKTINYVINFYKMTSGALLNLIVSPTLWKYFTLIIILVHSAIFLYNPPAIYDLYMLLYKYAKEIILAIYNIISKLVQAIATLIEAISPV